MRTKLEQLQALISATELYAGYTVEYRRSQGYYARDEYGPMLHFPTFERGKRFLEETQRNGVGCTANLRTGQRRVAADEPVRPRETTLKDTYTGEAKFISDQLDALYVRIDHLLNLAFEAKGDEWHKLNGQVTEAQWQLDRLTERFPAALEAMYREREQ